MRGSSVEIQFKFGGGGGGGGGGVVFGAVFSLTLINGGVVARLFFYRSIDTFPSKLSDGIFKNRLCSEQELVDIYMYWKRVLF